MGGGGLSAQFSLSYPGISTRLGRFEVRTMRPESVQLSFIVWHACGGGLVIRKYNKKKHLSTPDQCPY